MKTIRNESDINTKDEENFNSEFKEPSPSPLTDFMSDIYCLTIVGQIEGHVLLPPSNKSTKYEHVLPLLVGIEENPKIKGMLLVLNTSGGDVEAGLAIAEMIAGMKTPTVSLVLGGGHSIGVPLSVSTDYSFIAPTATMTVHPIRINGMVIGIPQTYNYLNKMQKRIINFILKHSKIDESVFTEMLYQTGELADDTGTILVGNEAVESGLIDEIGGVNDALTKLKSFYE